MVINPSTKLAPYRIGQKVILHISNSKLVKFLNNTKEPTIEKNFTPVISSHSKGHYLQNHERGSHPVEREIIFWSKGGAKIKDRFNWLKSVLQQKVTELGAIRIYVWLGTCDLTSYNKKYISISSYSDEILTVLSYYYNKIINLVQQYENCKVTILETPVYSIYHWNCKVTTLQSTPYTTGIVK